MGRPKNIRIFFGFFIAALLFSFIINILAPMRSLALTFLSTPLVGAGYVWSGIIEQFSLLGAGKRSGIIELKKENTYLFNKTMGFCKSQINTENKSLKKSTIKVYLNPDELFEKSKKIHITMLHELGHSLGLFNQSSDPEDIMYYAVNKIKPLSQRDKNSIKWLYKFPCGIKIKDIFLKYEKPETSNIDALICELENNIDENCFSLI